MVCSTEHTLNWGYRPTILFTRKRKAYVLKQDHIPPCLRCQCPHLHKHLGLDSPKGWLWERRLRAEAHTGCCFPGGSSLNWWWGSEQKARCLKMDMLWSHAALEQLHLLPWQLRSISESPESTEKRSRTSSHGGAAPRKTPRQSHTYKSAPIMSEHIELERLGTQVGH